MGLRDNGRGNALGTGFGKFGFWWPQSCFPTVLLHIMWNKSSILVINLNFISIQTLFRPYLHTEGASNHISGGQTGIKLLLCSRGKPMTPLCFGPLRVPCPLLPELKSKTVTKSAAVGARVPRHCQEQLKQTLNVCLIKMHLFLLFQTLGEGLGPPCSTPGLHQCTSSKNQNSSIYVE